MTHVTVLSEEDVRSLVEIDQLVESLEDALRAVAQGTVSAPERTSAQTPKGGLYAMSAFVPRQGLAAKLISDFPGNASRRLPTHPAVGVLFDPETGHPLCVLGARWLTAIRTAATTAIATRVLASESSRSLAIIGSGVQAAAHLQTVTRVRQFDDIRIASRTFERARQLADSWPGARAVPYIHEAVADADVVCGCIDCELPVIQRSWLKYGAHVNSVGGFRGTEVDGATVRDATVYVESMEAVAPSPVGSRELQSLSPASVTLLGDLLRGSRPTPVREGHHTLYKSIGHAAEDVAAFRHVYENALRTGSGRPINL